MDDRFEHRPDERRRRGPLGEDAEGEETRREMPLDDDPDATRQVPTQWSEGGDASSETRPIPRRQPAEPEEKETRVIRTPGLSEPQGDATPYPRGYFEAAEEREDRLRDMYGGVDWLASFLGFVFSLVAGAVFVAVAGLVIGLLGLSLNLSAAEIGAAAITGLVLLGVLIFLTYFFGGYVAGRLARFDGGRNGAMLLVWTLIFLLLLVIAGGILSRLLPPDISETVNSFVRNDVVSAIEGFSQAGLVGIAVAVGALLFALLGAILGGRLGGRYHAEIDRSS